MAPAGITLAEYQCTVESLRGACLVGVKYYPLSCGDDGTDIREWDFGDWHQPTMGVELLTREGGRYFATWDQSFDYWGLEIIQMPESDALGPAGQRSCPTEVDVTGHLSWAGLLGVPLTTVDIVWSEGGYGRPVPIAVRLSTATATVWLVAGAAAQWPPDGQFHLGTDDVMVVFSRDLATTIALPT